MFSKIMPVSCVQDGGSEKYKGVFSQLHCSWLTLVLYSWYVHNADVYSTVGHCGMY